MLMLIETLTDNGFEHYEISNFAKGGMYARHNTNYWKGKHYLGLGPSAHSFNGISRSWNIANNARYISAIQNGTSFQETENLTLQDRTNEYIMTALRTMCEIDLSYVEHEFRKDALNNMLAEAQSFISGGHLVLNNTSLVLSKQVKIIADHIISGLFTV